MKILKYLLIFSAVALTLGCSGNDPDPEPDPGPEPPKPSGDVELSLDRTVIHANGEDAAEFIVIVNGEQVTEGVTIYNAQTNEPLSGLTFTTTETGTYSFWASYEASNSARVTLTAIAFPVPELPADPNPDGRAFVRKVLLTQFTGTGCGWCPGMITIMGQMLDEEDYASKVELAAAHNFNSDDPCYLSQRLDQAMGVSSFPYVVADMYMGFNNYNSLIGLKRVVDDSYARSEALAGICAKAELNDNTLVVHVGVKAGETRDFRVGAWLLEDGIYGKQSNYTGLQGDFDTHNNVIRMADSKVSSVDYSGYALGQIEAGKTGEHVFVIEMDEKWVKSACRLLLFVTTDETEQKLVVNNVVSCPLDGEVEYAYE